MRNFHLPVPFAVNSFGRRLQLTVIPSVPFFVRKRQRFFETRCSSVAFTRFTLPAGPPLHLRNFDVPPSTRPRPLRLAADLMLRWKREVGPVLSPQRLLMPR